VLLVEVDPNERASHGATLASRGYAVEMAAAWPSLTGVALPAILISDVASYEALRKTVVRRLPPVVVLADDPHAGVSACLSGADAWVPTHGDGAYLLDTVDGLVHPFGAPARDAAQA
jgi:hypothetical protein